MFYIFRSSVLDWRGWKAARLAAFFIIVFAEPVPAATPLSPDRLPTSRADQQWPMSAKDYANTRFSELDAITAANAHTLKLIWSYDFDSGRGVETAPLVVGTTMYVATQWPSTLYALDLNPISREHPVKWIYEAKSVAISENAPRCDVGICFADGRVFMNTQDGHMIAVDATTGAEIWKTQVANTGIGETLGPPTLVVAGKVLVGNGGGATDARGWVKALDAISGAVRWTAFSTGPHASAKAWISYDPGVHAIYYGNASPNSGNAEPGSEKNAWTSSLVARDPETGNLRWSYQWASHEAFDCDVINENILIDLAMNRHVRRVLLHADKSGHVYVLDRTSGDLISTTPFVPITSRKEVDASSPQGAGMGLQTTAYSPRTGLFYIPHQMPSMNSQFLAATATMIAKPASPKAEGRLVAWDPLAKKAAWTLTERSPFRTGALVTAGGVVFYGTSEGQMKAVNAQSGKMLWAFKANRAITGQPVTYLGPDGKQYVATLSGSEGQASERLLVFSLP